MSTRTGPFEESSWPTRLRAAVVEPTPHPRLHGYDLERDLAHHYTLAESMLLALCGAAPSEREGRVFEAVLVFASACPVNEAPTHAAVLARSIGAPVASAIGAGFMVACEASRAMLSEHEALLRWLCDGGAAGGDPAEVPACALSTDPRDAEAVAELRALLHEIGAPAMVPSTSMSRSAAIITIMWSCGLRSEDQLLVALSWAKLLSIGAEACAASRGGLTNFPARLPDFRYEAPQR